jgi:DNA-binding HxlR family transcriptional regulator
MTNLSLLQSINTLKMNEIEKKYYGADDCPITASIDEVGGKWKPIIIWGLLKGPKRFGELHHLIPGMALKVLSRQLKELEANGIVIRTPYPEVPPRVEYSLTEKGLALKSILDLLSAWSQEYVMQCAS